MNTYIEDSIAQKDPLIKILRLVCMQSVCNNGLKQKVLDFYKREILQVTVMQVSFKGTCETLSMQGFWRLWLIPTFRFIPQKKQNYF